MNKILFLDLGDIIDFPENQRPIKSMQEFLQLFSKHYLLFGLSYENCGKAGSISWQNCIDKQRAILSDFPEIQMIYFSVNDLPSKCYTVSRSASQSSTLESCNRRFGLSLSGFNKPSSGMIDLCIAECFSAFKLTSYEVSKKDCYLLGNTEESRLLAKNSGVNFFYAENCFLSLRNKSF